MNSILKSVIFSCALMSTIHCMEEEISKSQHKIVNSRKLSTGVRPTRNTGNHALNLRLNLEKVTKDQRLEDDDVAPSSGFLGGCFPSLSKARESHTKNKIKDAFGTQKVTSKDFKNKIELQARGAEELFKGVVNNDPRRILHAIIVYCADVNARDSLGWTPMHYAARDRSIAAVQVLLANPDLDLTIKDLKGSTVFDILRLRAECATRLQQEACESIKTACLKKIDNCYEHAIVEDELFELEHGSVVVSIRQYKDLLLTNLKK